MDMYYLNLRVIRADAITDLHECESASIGAVNKWKATVKYQILTLGNSPGITTYNRASDRLRHSTMILQHELLEAEMKYLEAKADNKAAMEE